MATTKNRSRAPVPEPPKRRVPVVGIVFGLLAVLIVATIVLSGGSEAGPQFGDVALEGEVLPPYPEGQTSFETDPSLGATIPTITGIDLDGNAMSIGADGQAEVPRVTEWVASTGGVEGVEIVSVATSTNPVATNYPPDEWLREENWPAEAMRDDEAWLQKMRSLYTERRDVLVEGLHKLGLKAEKPKATFYVWIEVPEGYTSASFVAHLLEKCGIVTTPGNGFGDPGEGFFRMALTVPRERLQEALVRMKEVGF